MRVKGKIERVSQREKGYGILIEETWYNGYGKSPHKIGDMIDSEYKDKEDEESGTVYHYLVESDEEKSDTHTPTHNTHNQQIDTELIRTILELQMTPKLHVGLTKEVDDKIIKCGNYDKVLVKTYTVNITLPVKSVQELELNKIRAMQKMAEYSIEEQIITEKEAKESPKEPYGDDKKPVPCIKEDLPPVEFPEAEPLEGPSKIDKAFEKVEKDEAEKK